VEGESLIQLGTSEGCARDRWGPEKSGNALGLKDVYKRGNEKKMTGRAPKGRRRKGAKGLHHPNRRPDRRDSSNRERKIITKFVRQAHGGGEIGVEEKDSGPIRPTEGVGGNQQLGRHGRGGPGKGSVEMCANVG